MLPQTAPVVQLTTLFCLQDRTTTKKHPLSRDERLFYLFNDEQFAEVEVLSMQGKGVFFDE
ncbi:MAG: hypothetical protein JNJ85_12785 [Candidatus Kapabacteria bacterium]|nr:hypothetical protein [Candidatus Kapabacteria bacterium]